MDLLTDKQVKAGGAEGSGGHSRVPGRSLAWSQHPLFHKGKNGLKNE